MLPEPAFTISDASLMVLQKTGLPSGPLPNAFVNL